LTFSSSHGPTSRGALFALALLATDAEAPAEARVSADQCIDSNNQAQTLRREGKFSEARAELTTCADASCPHLVRSDCVRRLDELDRAQPTIVFDVKDGDGNDVVSVKVSVDGRPLVVKITGTALPADPGERVFSFESPGLPSLTRSFVLKEGEKGRRERIVLNPASSPRVVPPAAIPEKAPPASLAPASPGRIAGLALGGAGVAGVGVGAVFGLLAISANSAQKSDCRSAMSCTNHMQAVFDHDAFETDGTASTIAFLAGGALFVTGVVLFFVSGRSASREQSAAWVVLPSAVSGGSGLALFARF
jgi:hypothetical protein